MSRYAVLNAGQIVEYREIVDWAGYPAHKKAALDEKGDGGPVLRPVTVEGVGSSESIVIELDRVRRVLSIPAPTIDDVVRERERRLALGFPFNFGDARGIHTIGTTDDDMKGWGEVTTLAQAAINLGAPTTPIAIETNTGPVTVTAMEWQSILAAAGQFRQPIWAASFALQAASPIPSDYASDSQWST